MIEPQIRYATTSDGVSIAYSAIGRGERVVLFLMSPASHLEAEWRIPQLRAAFTLAAQQSTLVRMDPRGFGNVFGGAVNIAARIAGESAAGEVLVSDVVRGLARTSANVSFEDRGERELRGVGEPVRVWAVRGL